MRKQRKLSNEVKNKISSSLKGRVLKASTKSKISESMKLYWQSIPYVKDEDNTFISESNV